MAGDLAKFTKNKNVTKDNKELECIKNSVVKRMETIDKMSKMIEDTLSESETLGSPLTLSPGSLGYEDTIELFIKLTRAQKDLVESFRKLKLTEFDLRDREQKVALRDAFAKALEGKSLEEIKTLVRAGNFTPANIVAGTLFGSAVVDGDTNAARSIMSGITDWGSEDEFTDAAPQLTVNLNLSDMEKEKMRSAGQAIPETINITPAQGE